MERWSYGPYTNLLVGVYKIGDPWAEQIITSLLLITREYNRETLQSASQYAQLLG